MEMTLIVLMLWVSQVWDFPTVAAYMHQAAAGQCATARSFLPSLTALQRLCSSLSACESDAGTFFSQAWKHCSVGPAWDFPATAALAAQSQAIPRGATAGDRTAEGSA